MGYDLHIVRRQNWFDEDATKDISLQEWVNYVNGDADMRLDNYAAATTIEGEKTITVSEGLSVWTAYSKDGINGNHAWFGYYEGCIAVKNPDDEIIKKMVEISIKLNAKVQGDDGEFYR